MNIRPIKNEDDYQQALSRIDDLWDAEIGTADGDALEVLSTLVEDYEARHHAIPPPGPIEAILFRMDQLGLTRKDLEPLIGSRARVSEVLGRKRSLTLAMIRRVHKGLGIPAEVLIQPSEERAS